MSNIVDANRIQSHQNTITKQIELDKGFPNLFGPQNMHDVQ
jgi:hypothetical protein